MLIIGLTGGIGSGKSTASACFAALGVPIIDADDVGRELVTPGSPALHEIASAFGPGVLNPEGQLDRAALRRHIFTHPAERKRLESILHPRIRAEMLRRVHALTTPYCILAIPLLLESGWTDMVDRILVIDAPLPLQQDRASRRDGITSDELERILAAQLPREYRLAAAQDIISNDDSLDVLKQQVGLLHAKYLDLATGRARD